MYTIDNDHWECLKKLYSYFISDSLGDSNEGGVIFDDFQDIAPKADETNNEKDLKNEVRVFFS